ncbi:MAG: SIR2 family NAD-dependent protein deacylase [Rudaea sp.]
MTEPHEIPDRLAELLQSARSITVLTGSGVSAESGVPTFREALTGLWATFDPEELATRSAFLRNPRLVWEWYAERRRTVQRVEPNPGHFALARLEQMVPNLTLITQNVDGLHQRAGSRRVLELHGNITQVKCFDEDTAVAAWPEDEQVPPRCPRCGGLLRPDVVWFGEALPAQALRAAMLASRNCDLFFSVGTSGVVEPAASLPYDALRARVPMIEINPDSTPLSRHATFRLVGPSGLLLPLLIERTWGHDAVRASSQSDAR